MQAYSTQLSKSGKWAFFLSLLLVFSISIEYRIEFAGLFIHPFLLALPFALFFTGDLLSVSSKVTTPLFIFFFLFTMGSLQNDNPVLEVFKVGSSVVTFLFFASSVKSERDFRWISWGFIIVAFVLGVIGFFLGQELEGGRRLEGINSLEGLGNKNAQSLFTLPGLFMGVWLLLTYLRRRKWIATLTLVVVIFFITVQIFLSANRSGWLGLVVVFISFLFYSGFRKATIFIGASIVFFAYVAIEKYAGDIVERKREQTVEGYTSDIGRQQLMRESLLVGISHPIFGIGKDELHREMARRLHVNRVGINQVDTHFLIGYIFGATGLFTLIAFLLFLLRLTEKERLIPNYARRDINRIRFMVMSFVILFVIRSLFSREILYSPTFIGGLGLVYGYYKMKVLNAWLSPQ
jgi:hypothetical protein